MTAQHIPQLERICGSWVVTRKDTGEVVGEFYSRAIVAKLNPGKVLIETALQYLGRVNRAIAK